MSHKKLKTILYAEDEEDIRVIAQIALEDIGGFSVQYCANGIEALDVARSFVPDLLLLDVMMPEKDGPTTLLELRNMSEFTSVPVIFMTAKIQANEIESYKKLGAIDVITKPFDPLTLADLIKKAWETYHEQD